MSCCQSLAGYGYISGCIDYCVYFMLFSDFCLFASCCLSGLTVIVPVGLLFFLRALSQFINILFDHKNWKYHRFY